MSIRRQQNWVSQQRVDVPHMRSIESAVANDFDELIKAFITSNGDGYVIRGFELNVTGSIGSASNGLQLLVANSALFHPTSSESGTYYVVPNGTTPEILNSTTNERVDGAFTPNAVNYIGLEYERIVDDSTTDIANIWDPTTNTEIPKSIPQARILRYKIVITTSIWAANVLPIAKVTTDAANNVSEITDQRPMLFRLGTAGRSTPNPAYVYPWTNHTEGRQENASTTTNSSINPFRGGDKQITTLKEWMDAMMSSMLEVKGTTFWYSDNIGGSILDLRADLANTVFTGRGSISHDDVTAGKINWTNNIAAKLVGSDLSYTISANVSSSDIVLADNECAYINLVRNVAIVPNLIWTNSSATVASVGAVAWTSNLQAGDFIKIATDTITKYYEIQSVDSASQVTLSTVYAGTSTGPSGEKSQYAFGVYETNPAPSTDRHIYIADRDAVPFDKDTFWILLRADNGGTKPRVYVRFIAAELEQGEDREINDNQTTNIVDYIGSLSESSSEPVYSTSIANLETEITEITLPAASSITSGQSFTINTANDNIQYYVWFNKDGAGGNPAIIGKTPIEVAISTGDTNLQVAADVASALTATGNFSAVDNLDGTITVTNALAGDTTDAANVDVGGVFAITVSTQGSGESNHYVVDTENLTMTIKRLDEALNDVASGLDGDSYEEDLVVVSGAPSDDNEITGPITAPQNITIPYDSKNANAVKSYTVGSGKLSVFLNGVKIGASEYAEVGAIDSESNEINLLYSLVVGDVLTFRIESPTAAIGGGGGGGGEANTASNLGAGSQVFKSKVGVDLQFRSLVAGAGVSISQGTNDITITSTPSTANDSVVTVTGSNYGATAANDVILAAASGANRTITLPSAVGNSGKKLVIKKIDSGNTIFVATILSQTIDGVDCTASPYALTVTYESMTIISDNVNWWII